MKPAPIRRPEPESEVRSSAPQDSLTSDERTQIAARLRLTPNERLQYLEDMIAFEEAARRARRVT